MIGWSPNVVVGWRAWQLHREAGEYRVQSIHFHRDKVWQPHEQVTAECHRRGGADTHHAPGSGCYCGIHAAPDTSLIGEYIRGCTPDARRVYGRVNLWGRVVEHERGWRAEHAYPARFVVPRRLADAEAVALDLTAYGVPVELEEGVEDGRRRAAA